MSTVTEAESRDTTAAEDGAAPRLRFRPDIEGLRAIAVLLVVLDHLHVVGFRAGFVGVDVFFVISGFLITSLIRDEFAANEARFMPGGGTISFGAFYLRRAKRILPAALTTIAAVLIAAKLFFNEVRFSQVQADALWATFFGANFQLMQQATDYFAQTDLVSPLQNFWSLAVEEQFYIVWPALFLIAASLPKWVAMAQQRIAAPAAWARSATVAIATLGIASLAWSAYATSTSPGSAYFSPFTRAWELALGATLAMTPAVARALHGRRAQAASAAGIGFLVLALVLITPETAFPGLWALLPTLGAALILAAGINPGNRTAVASALGRKGPRWVGRISYSLYLWHWPIIVFAAALYPKGAVTVPGRLMLFALSVGVAFASYRFIEEPFRRIKAPREELARMEWLRESRPKLIRLTASGLIVVGVIALLARPAPPAASSAVAAAPASLQKWAGWKGGDELAGGASTANPNVDAGGKVTGLGSGWLKAVKAGNRETVATPAELDQIKAGKAMGPSDSCYDATTGALSESCTLAGAGSPLPDNLTPKTVALVGNSYAAQWRNSIATALPQGASLVPFTLAGCHPDATKGDTKQTNGVVCSEHRSWSTGQIQRLRPDLTIISATTSSRTALMGKLVKDLRKAGPVLWIGPPPETPKFESCLGSDNRISQCKTPVPGSLATNRAFAGAAASANATYMDLAPILCLNMTCPTFIKGQEVRFDGSHLTTWALDTLSPVVRQAIIQTLQSAKKR